MSISIENGRIVTASGVSDGIVAVEGATITAVDQDAPPGEVRIDASGCYVMPGFIDLHVHGGAGSDVMDEEQGAIGHVCRFHAAHGTTGMLLTTRTMPKAMIDEAILRLAEYIQNPCDDGAEPLGIHLEGPFLHVQYRGAQNEAYILPPSLEALTRWYADSGNQIKLVTLAPEAEGAEAVLAWLASRGIIASAGHCGPDYDQMKRAIEQGVRHTTHCYNGMRSFTHRDPGMLAVIWTDRRVTAELIMDGCHVHPGAAKLLHYTKGVDGMVLITDAVRAAGAEDGVYESAGGRTVIVQDGIVTLPSGQLAGSSLTMNRAVRNSVELMELPIHEAVAMASLTPAKILGIQDRKGSIAVGKDADLVITDRDFRVLLTMRAGKTIYRSEAFGGAVV